MEKVVSIVKTQLLADLTRAYLVCGVFAPGQLLPCPKLVLADPLPKHLVDCSLVQCYKSSRKL